jgi:hypothetical protein
MAIIMREGGKMAKNMANASIMKIEQIDCISARSRMARGSFMMKVDGILVLFNALKDDYANYKQTLSLLKIVSMKKNTIIFGVFIFAVVHIISCGGANNNTMESASSRDSPLSSKSANSPFSLTKDEANKRMQSFLQENHEKYSNYGEVQEIELTGGNYTSDGVLDYFCVVHFYPGGDWVYPLNFFYESDKDKVRELTFGNGPEILKTIALDNISERRLKGKAIMWLATSGVDFAKREIDAEFIIEGNKVFVNIKYLPLLSKGEKEILKELEVKRMKS